jgi:acyl carrier protein
MTEDVLPKVLETFARVFPDFSGADADADKTRQQFANWDSFSHLELVSALEEAFRVSFSLDEVVAIETPRAFAEVIASKV